MKQMTLATIEGFEVHGRATRKAAFLARMEMLVPWTAFYALIELHYLKTGNGRPPVGLERMFLILGFSGLVKLVQFKKVNKLPFIYLKEGGDMCCVKNGKEFDARHTNSGN